MVSEPSVARQISRNPKSFRNLLHEMGQAIAASAHGVSSVIVVNVRPGKPHPEIEIIKSGADDDGASELERALAEARERGRKLAAEILSGDEMLSSDAFADRIGVRRPTIHSKRERHEILGLEGPKRGVQFPAWQLDEHGHLFMAGVLPKLFACLGDEWTVYRFLTQAHPEIGKMRTALEALQRGEIAPVLKAAENIASGAFT
ncbi:MAG TPA: hypothetical protein VE397_15610 [Stellaceae bacterium]|nr:hypothetical protein [Stellaceae bacterium]